MFLGQNQIYRELNRECPFTSGCDISCGMDATNSSMLSIADFQRKCGLGMGTTVHPVPTATELEGMARDLLEIRR
jgi:hypothetical protein